MHGGCVSESYLSILKAKYTSDKVIIKNPNDHGEKIRLMFLVKIRKTLPGF